MGELTSNPWAIVIAAGAIVGGLVKAGMWIGSVNTDRKNFGKSIENDRKDFRTSISNLADEIRADIKEILSRLPRAPIAAGSPLRLTDFGKQIADQIKAEEWSEQLCASGKLRTEVEGRSPYEIQEFSLELAQSKLEYTDTELDLLRQCAFDNGIEVEAVKRVLGIVLRDRLLPPELVN